MIYLIYGNDKAKSVSQFNKLVASVHHKKPGTPIFSYVGADENFSSLLEVVSGNSLFEAKYIVTLRHFFDQAESKQFLLDHLRSFSESEHLIFILEKEISKTDLNQFKKYAKDIKEYSKAEEKKDKFIFTLGDALGERNRQRLWVLYQEALQIRGIEPEEIFWRFVSQVKNMLVVKQASNPSNLKMHPFVLQKTNRAAKNFSLEELKTLSGQLVKMYDDARNGRREFGVMLERMVLEI
jgi:DNA polymerase III delta subunit